MKKIFKKSTAANLITMLCLNHCLANAQIPSAALLFERMKQRISSIRTISYQLTTRHLNALSGTDSIFQSSSFTWVKRVPNDSVYGAYFHIKQKNTYGNADYYYDGSSGIDIIHAHSNSALSKSITQIEPFRMNHGLNSVQTAVTAMTGYFKELVSTKTDEKWERYIPSMTVSDGKNYWVVHWEESSPDNYKAQHQLLIDKETYLIHGLNKNATWNGVPENLKVFAENIQINRVSDGDSVSLKHVYTDYKINFLNRQNYGKKVSPISVPANSKAKIFKYESLDGIKVSIHPQKGKLLLLDFWETWCGACFVAMPKLRLLHDEFKDKGLEIVAVVTENKENVRKIVAQQQFPYPTIFADEEVRQIYDLESRPRYILVDSSGNIVADSHGDLLAIISEIKRLLQ